MHVLAVAMDMGINKAIKTVMREEWKDWMIDKDGIVNGVAKEPFRKWWWNGSWMFTRTFRVNLQGMHG